MDVSKSCWCKITLIFLLSANNFILAQNNSKLNIDIFYESRCPDSRSFMQDQLKRTYPKIKDRVKINYVPFGKAYSFDNNGRTIFNCQHGQRECEGNIFQSCVLDAIGSQRQDVQTSFVICAMDFSKNPVNCAQNLGIDLGKISECTSGNKGLELQLKAEKDSAPVVSRSFFVPTIVYNNVYNAGDFWESLEDFEGVVNNKLRKL